MGSSARSIKDVLAPVAAAPPPVPPASVLHTLRRATPPHPRRRSRRRDPSSSEAHATCAARSAPLRSRSCFCSGGMGQNRLKSSSAAARSCLRRPMTSSTSTKPARGGVAVTITGGGGDEDGVRAAAAAGGGRRTDASRVCIGTVVEEIVQLRGGRGEAAAPGRRGGLSMSESNSMPPTGKHCRLVPVATTVATDGTRQEAERARTAQPS